MENYFGKLFFISLIFSQILANTTNIAGWIVRFVKGASLLGHDIKLITSIAGEIKWTQNSDELASFAEIVCLKAGVFTYNVYENE